MHIGMDIGGTNIACGVIGESGQFLRKKTIPTKGGREKEAILRDMAGLANGMKTGGPGEIKALGIGVPGIVAKGKDFIHYCPNINLAPLNMKEEMEKRTGLPTFVGNDGNLAALAEHEGGSLMGAQNAILLTLGTGIGGGAIVNGEILTGENGSGFEVGHMVIGKNHYDCNCGKNGCFETFASASALVRHTEKLLAEKGAVSSLLRLKELDAKSIVDAAKKGDRLAKESFDRLVSYLGIGIVNLMNLFDPEIVALGGGLSGAGDFLTEPLEKKVESLMLVKDFPHAEIRLARLGNDAGVIGAAMLAKEMNEAKQ